MGIVVFCTFLLCAFYVQNRGVIRHKKLSRRINDHSNFLGPINCLFYAFSSIKNSVYIDVELFPELKIIQQNWQVIGDEAVNLHASAQIKASEELDDLGFNSFFRTGWKRFYLKWYGASLASANHLCPKTVAILNDVPSVKGAMFAMLPPGARLVKHRDPYAGSLRYHLGLVTPNSEDCFIVVDGKKYWWRDGEAVMFDETYIHYAENKTDKTRIVLLLDIKRPVKYAWVDWINQLFSRLIMAATATKNIKGDKVGFLNKIFCHVYQIRIVSKKIKAYNRTVYYVSQYVIAIFLIYLLFF